MLKTFLIAASLILAPTFVDAGTMKHDMFDTVIQISNTESKRCSAFSIGEGFYMTAAHCVEYSENASGMSSIEVYDGPMKPDNIPEKSTYYKWKMFVTVPQLDLAIIHFDDVAMKRDSVLFADIQPELGERVYSVGFPAYYEKTIVEGLAGSPHFYDASMILEEDAEIRKAKGIKPAWVERSTDSVPVYEGMSGGPKFVYDGKDYRVYSINSVKDGLVTFMSMGPTTAQMKDFLETAKIQMIAYNKILQMKKTEEQSKNPLRIK